MTPERTARRAWRAAAVAALASALALPSRAHAADALPPSTQANLLLKVLSYDRALASRAAGEVVVAVIAKPGDAASVELQGDIASALEDASGRFNVGGMKVRVVKVAWATRARLDADLSREHASAAYVCGGLRDQISAISAAARARQALSFSFAEPEVRQGLSVALLRNGERPALMVNLAASRAEGADLDSAFLRVAEVIQ